jgi:hypothetical protein
MITFFSKKEGALSFESFQFWSQTSKASLRFKGSTVECESPSLGVGVNRVAGHCWPLVRIGISLHMPLFMSSPSGEKKDPGERFGVMIGRE